MAKLRAYKLAEELKLEPDDFLKKAKAIGIDLRSKMASVDDDQVEEIRRRLGVVVTGQRVEKRVGKSVIRRRKKVEAPAAEVEAAATDAEAVVEPEAPVAEAEVPATPVEEPEPVAAEAVEPEAPAAPKTEQPVVQPARGPVVGLSE